jgi:hypothetical protein
LDLDESVELSVAESLLVDFSDFFVLLLVESASVWVLSALLFFSLVVFGLVALSEAGLLVVAGLFVVAGDFVVAAAVEATLGDGFTLALADGVIVAATLGDAAGVIVAPTLAVAAGVALAFVEAVTPVVVPVVVVPEVEVTPTLKLGVTP